jgi:hypothetical protein
MLVQRTELMVKQFAPSTHKTCTREEGTERLVTWKRRGAFVGNPCQSTDCDATKSCPTSLCRKASKALYSSEEMRHGGSLGEHEGACQSALCKRVRDHACASARRQRRIHHNAQAYEMQTRTQMYI